MPPSSSAIRAGRAFVQLFAEPNQLYRALDQAKKRVLDFAKFTAKVGVGAAGLGGAVLTPIAKFFTDAVNQGADVELLARRFHTTAESLSTLRGAFAQAGIPAEEFGGIMDSLATKIAGAADSRDELIQGLTGLRGDFLLGKGLDEQLDLIAEKFKTIKSAEDQIRVANELGLGGMIDYLKKGKEGLDAMRAAAIANGDAMSGEDAKAGLEIQREYNRSLLSVKSTLIAVGKALLPTGKSFAELGADLRDGLQTVRAWISEHKSVIVVVTAVAAGLVAAGAALVGFAGAVATIAPIIAGVVIAIKAMVATISFLVSPVGLVVVGITAIGVGIGILIARTEAGQRAIGEMLDAFKMFGKWIASSWKGITDAIGAGNWSLGFEIAIATMNVAWTGFVYGLTATWTDFKKVFVDGWEEATTWLAKILVDLGAAVLRNTVGVIAKVVEAFNSIARAIDPDLQIKVSGLLSDEDINRNRDEVKKALDDMAKEQQARREKFRKEQTETAFNDFLEATRELEALKKQAAEEAGKKYGGLFNRIAEAAKNAKPGGGSGGGLPSFTQLFANQKGIFGGNSVQQQLGIGDNIAQRQLDVATATATNTGKQVALLEEIKNKPGEVWV